MKMPLRDFWSSNAQIGRLRAEESLDQIDVLLAGSGNVGEEGIKELRASLQARMGQPMIFSSPLVDDSQVHSEGIAKLREILGQG